MTPELSISWDSTSDRWNTKLHYGNKDVAISFYPESVEYVIKSRNLILPPEIEQSLRSCADLILTSGDNIQNRVAEKLFDGWRKDWYDEKIDTFDTFSEFKRALILDGAIISDCDGGLQIDFVYKDSGVFGGHWIRTTLDETGNIKDGPFMEG